jgi:hypothetical protein
VTLGVQNIEEERGGLLIGKGTDRWVAGWAWRVQESGYTRGG